MKKKMTILMTVLIMLAITASALPLLVGANDKQGPNIVRTFIDDKGREIDEVIVGEQPENDTQGPNIVRTFIDDKGQQIDEVSVPGRPPEIKAPVVVVPEPDIAKGINVLSNAPAFDWSYGCSATAAAMMFGHYDNTVYTNMYAGPTNGGVMPMTSVWGSTAYPGVTCWECPLSATHNGVDGRTTLGHVDDYWVDYGSTSDPYYGNWAEHGYADCTADFMGTNQYNNWENSDGMTRFYYYTNGDPLYDYSGCEPGKRDGCHGVRLFVESRGYNVHHNGTYYQNYNQYIHEHVSGGFTFAQFQAEIDAGRPVLIQVSGHTMLGYGYNTAGNIVYIHDTWDCNDHQMTWGGTYSGLQHYGVTVIQLEPESLPFPALNLAVRGTDNGVWYNFMDTSGSWYGWEHVQSGYTYNSPVITTCPDGTAHIAVRGTDSGVWYINRNSTTGSWSGWQHVGGGYTYNSPSLTCTWSGTVHLTVRGTDSGVWHTSRNSTTGTWAGWQHVQSGYTYSTPAISSIHTLYLTAQGTDNGVWYNNRDASTGSWGGWQHVQNGYTYDATANSAFAV